MSVERVPLDTQRVFQALTSIGFAPGAWAGKQVTIIPHHPDLGYYPFAIDMSFPTIDEEDLRRSFDDAGANWPAFIGAYNDLEQAER